MTAGSPRRLPRQGTGSGASRRAPREHRLAPVPAAAAWRRPAFLGGLGAAVLVALLVGAVAARGGRPFGIDVALHAWLRGHRTSGLTATARMVTETGTGIPALFLAALAARLWARPNGWVRPVLLAVGVLAGVQLLRLGLAEWIGRVRPPVTDWAAEATGFALPSGHATTSAAVAALFVLAARNQRDRLTRGCAALAVGWAFAVGLTRVYLGVHWPSDVVAGWLLVLALALPAASSHRPRPHPPR